MLPVGKLFGTLQTSTYFILACFVILGDFNARVGPRQDDEWCYERGPNGYGVLNDVGKELLNSLIKCIRCLTKSSDNIAFYGFCLIISVEL